MGAEGSGLFVLFKIIAYDMQEEFINIMGFEDYKVSNMGRLLSYKRTKPIILKPRKKAVKIKTGQYKKNQFLPYLSVALYANKNRSDLLVHRIVAKHFIDNPENKPQVNHKNGDVSDNRVENLEWVTSSENVIYSIKEFGRIEKCGEDNNKSKLTETQVKEIRELYPIIKSQRKIAKLYNVTQTAIKNIVNNKTWKHI